MVLVLDLSASGLILARIGGTPIHILATIFAGVTVGTVTRIVSGVILTSGTVQTRITVAQINPMLAICPSESKPKDILLISRQF